MVGSLEHLSAQMMYNASQLSSVLLKKVDQIIKNKRYIHTHVLFVCVYNCTGCICANVYVYMCIPYVCSYVHVCGCVGVWVCGCVGVSE